MESRADVDVDEEYSNWQQSAQLSFICQVIEIT